MCLLKCFYVCWFGSKILTRREENPLRIILFVAFLAFSVVAAADTIDYAGGGSVKNRTGTITGSIANGKTWSVTDELMQIDDETIHVITRGDLGKVDITTGTLMACSTGFCFSGGSLDITNSSGGTLFDGAFTSGTITQSGGNTFLNASLANGGTVLIKSKSGAFSTDSIITTTAATTPEPSTLGLLGSGLIGLAFMRQWARRGFRDHPPVQAKAEAVIANE
jgi:hypothetical protein